MRPRTLARGLAAARQSAPHLQALAEHLLPAAPGRPLASQNIRSITVRPHSDPFPLSVAVTLPWIAFDAEHFQNIIAIDIDHANGSEHAAALAGLGLPMPTLVIDTWSGRSHGLLRLSSPVYTDVTAQSGPKRLLGYAGRLVAAAMGGTLLHRRSLVKSSWARSENLIGTLRRHSRTPATPLLWEAHLAADTGLLWHTEPGELRSVELREVVAALVDDYGEGVASPGARQWRRNRLTPNTSGRNCMLFDVVRGWAYDRVERGAKAIHDYATRTNAETFADPLPDSEVAAIARSIAKFMATRYRPRSDAAPRRDDIAGSDGSMTPVQKRTLSGVVTAAERAAKTDAAIAEARAKIVAEGVPVTQAAIADTAGVSPRTLRRRRADNRSD
jgi:hypothetical protein